VKLLLDWIPEYICLNPIGIFALKQLNISPERERKALIQKGVFRAAFKAILRIWTGNKLDLKHISTYMQAFIACVEFGASFCISQTVNGGYKLCFESFSKCVLCTRERKRESRRSL